MQQFDRIDRKILDILQRNGRISITDLAQEVGLSSSPAPSVYGDSNVTA